MQLSLAHAFLDYIKKLCFRRIMKALLPPLTLHSNCWGGGTVNLQKLYFTVFPPK